MTYTQAPWEQNEYRDCIFGDGRVLAEKPKGTAKTWLADSQLMCAAPDMLDLLYEILPYIEMAEHDPIYKPGAVAKITKKIKDLIIERTKC